MFIVLLSYYKKVIRKHVTFLSKTKAMVRLQRETFKSLSLSNKITLDYEEQKVVGLWMVFRKVLMHVDTYKVSWQLLQCNSPFNMSLCLRIKHCLAGVSQLSQFDTGIFCTVQGHLTVLSGRVCRSLMRLTCCHLYSKQDERKKKGGSQITSQRQSKVSSNSVLYIYTAYIDR